MESDNRRFRSIERLYGSEEWMLMQSARIVVIGLGGVGCWAVEALARSGVQHLALVDVDILTESNINRHVAAMDTTFGMNKADALAQRCRSINPLISIQLHDCFLENDTLPTILDPTPDLVLDCCDDLQAKKLLVLWCRRRRIPMVLAGATGGKANPSELKIGDLALTERDPLLAKLRREIRRNHQPLAEQGKKWGVPVVYSGESQKIPLSCERADLSCSGMGSNMLVPCSMALLMVQEGLRHMIRRMRLKIVRQQH